MYVAVYVPLLLPLLAVPAVRAVAPRLDPRYAAWLLTSAAVVLAVSSTVVLAVLVAAGAADSVDPAVPPVPHLAPLIAWSAGTALAVLAVAALRTAVLRGRALADAYACSRELRDDPRHQDGELVVLPGPAPVAYALPGRPGRIVVSAGMLRALGAPQRRALLAHERAHLRGRHHLMLAATALAGSANPLLRPLVPCLAYTVERSADESAAREVGDRRTAAEAVARAALATGGPGGTAMPHAAALHAASGPVPRRVAALLAPPPHASTARFRVARAMAFAVACLLVLGVSSAAEAATDFHTALERAEVTAAAPHGQSG